MGSSEQQSVLHRDNAGEDQQEPVYQDCTTTEDIYCNQFDTRNNSWTVFVLSQ